MNQISLTDVTIYNHSDADCINVVVPTRLWWASRPCALPSLIFRIITLGVLLLILITNKPLRTGAYWWQQHLCPAWIQFIFVALYHHLPSSHQPIFKSRRHPAHWHCKTDCAELRSKQWRILLPRSTNYSFFLLGLWLLPQTGRCLVFVCMFVS